MKKDRGERSVPAEIADYYYAAKKLISGLVQSSDALSQQGLRIILESIDEHGWKMDGDGSLNILSEKYAMHLKFLHEEKIARSKANKELEMLGQEFKEKDDEIIKRHDVG